MKTGVPCSIIARPSHAVPCRDAAAFIKLKFHGTSFIVASRDIFARMSLTCHEEIGRVGRGCYGDPLEGIALVGLVVFGEKHDTRTNGQHYSAADRRPTNQVNAWQVER